METRGAASIYCPFASPGEPLAVRLQLRALNRLRLEVLAAKQSGRETAGILMGRVEQTGPAGSESVLVIDKAGVFSSVAPSGLLSKSDAEPSPRRRLTYKAESRPVGFFRVAFQSKRGPTEEEIQLIVSSIGDGKVLLLINGSDRPTSGTFYRIGSRGDSRVHASYPIRLDALSSNGHFWDGPAKPEAPSNGDYPDLPREDASPGSGRAAGHRSLTATQIGLMLAGLALVVFGGLQYRTMRLLDQQRQEASKTSEALDLKPERAGENQWRLSWNRSATAIRKASRGHVSIIDGYLRKEIDLTVADMQNGGIVYAPVGGDVTFRLEVFDLQAGRAASESIRVIASPWPYPATDAWNRREAIPDLPIGNRGGTLEQSLSRATERGASGELAAARLDREENPTPSLRTDRVGSPPPRPFAAPSPAADPVIVSRSLNDLPAPPTLSNTGPEHSAPALAALARAIAPPVPGPASVPTPPPTVERGPDSQARTFFPTGTAGSAGRPTPSSGVEPPTLLHRTDPQYPPIAVQLHLSGMVQLQATVGTDGHLHDARVVSGQPLLRAAALEAVKNWTYQPARLNGQNIAAPVSIEMRFKARQ